MKSIERNLLKKYVFGEITKESFVKEFPLEKLNKKQYGVKILREAIDLRNAEGVALGLSTMLIQADISNIIIQWTVLCDALSENWHFSHEDIVRVLADLAISTSAECLYTTAISEFEYLEYDDTYQLARKCIKGLAKIGNENSISKLLMLNNHKKQIIANYANKELKKLL